VGLVAILGIRVLPEVIDYYKIRQAVKAVAAESGGQDGARTSAGFGKYAEVEHIKTFGPADLDIFKEENQVVDCLCLREAYSARRQCQPADRLLAARRRHATTANDRRADLKRRSATLPGSANSCRRR
jgi:hypothetical protein